MNKAVLRESDLGGIITIGMCDGGYSSKSFTYPIPGNNEGIETMLYINNFYSRYILLKKFKNVILWYVAVGSSKNIGKYDKIKRFKNSSRNFSVPIRLSINIDYFKLFKGGIRLFFFKVYGYFIKEKKISVRVSNFNKFNIGGVVKRFSLEKNLFEDLLKVSAYKNLINY